MFKYWGGPWQWKDDIVIPGYYAPDNTIASIDLRNMATQSSSNHFNGVGNGFFCTDSSIDLGSDYTLLGIGNHITETDPESGAKSAWNSLFGVLPTGNFLIDYLSFTLTNGSDPEGLSAPKPLIPGAAPVGEVTISLEGHSVVFRRTINVSTGNSQHAKNVRDRLQKDIESIWDQDELLGRKVLGFNKRKFGQAWDDSNEDYLLTAKLKSKNKGSNGQCRAEKPETSYTETWPTAGTPGTGQDYGWGFQAGYTVGVAVSSGTLSNNNTATEWRIVMSSAVSGSDVTVYPKFLTYAGGVSHQYTMGRCAGTSDQTTFYGVYAYYTGSEYKHLIYKFVSDSPTLISDGTNTLSNGDTWGLKAVGSTISRMKNGTSLADVTDTAISSGTYGGIGGYAQATGFASDDWVFSDYSSGGGGSPIRGNRKMSILLLGAGRK